MRRYAAYNRCLAAQYSSGGSCGTGPTCSTACPSSAGSSGGSGINGVSTTNKTAQMNQMAEAVGNLLSQWAASRQAKHEQEALDLQQRAEQEAAQMEMESKAEDERARERTAFLADPSGGSMPSTPGDESDDTAKLRAQLYAQGVTASGQTTSLDPSDQMAQLRSQMTAQAQAEAVQTASETQPPSASSGAGTPQAPEPDQIQIQPSAQTQIAQIQAAMQPQQGSVFSGAYNQQSDDPADDQAGVKSYWDQMTGKIQAAFDDELDSLKTAAQPLVDKYHDILNDPSVQMAQTLYTLYKNGNIGAPNGSDTPEQMANKVFVPAMMIAPMALKDGATAKANANAVLDGAESAGGNVTTMLGLAAQDEDNQQ
jgi:hypothetical protein